MGRPDLLRRTSAASGVAENRPMSLAATMSADAKKPVLTTAMCALLQAVGGGLGWSLVPASMPEIARDLKLGHASAGAVFGAASLGIALASPLGGAAVDRFGARRTAGF